MLVFSFIGYTRKEVPVAGTTSSLSVTLEESTQALTDVVVIGYGTARNSDLTGSRPSSRRWLPPTPCRLCRAAWRAWK